MTKFITKTIVTEEGSSPYQSYPQFGDTVYMIDEFDHRMADIKEWCIKNTTGTYRSFNAGNAIIGFWFAAYDDGEHFEEEWL